MKIIIAVEPPTWDDADERKFEVPFHYVEKRSEWIAASDAIPIGDEAVIGVHAEIDAERKRLHVLFVHGGARLAGMMCELSQRQVMSFRFSPNHTVSASVEM